MIETRKYTLPDYNQREILRYAGIRQETPEICEKLEKNMEKCKGVWDGRVCFSRFPIRAEGKHLSLGFAEVDSSALSRNLCSCDEIILFAATVGLGIDRLIRRCGAADMADAVFLQAIGTERVEALCRCFCEDFRQEMAAERRFLRPRYSPGYGDVPLTLQNEVFRALDCSRRIGIALSDSLLMTPSKSVTAIVGIGQKQCSADAELCSYCDLEGCPFRREL